MVCYSYLSIDSFRELRRDYLQVSEKEYENNEMFQGHINSPYFIERIRRSLKALVPESEQEMNSILQPLQKEWEESIDRLLDAEMRWSYLEPRSKDPEEFLAPEEKRIIKQTEEAFLAAQAAMPNPATEVFEGVTIRDLLLIPTMLYERDAERGALSGLRTVRRETGINYFVDMRRPPDALLGQKEEQPQPMDLYVRIVERVGSLYSVSKHMDLIGVSMSCIRAIKQKGRVVSSLQ
jgi:hypothetical protein